MIQKLSDLCKIDFTEDELQYLFEDLNETLEEFIQTAHNFNQNADILTGKDSDKCTTV